jgi:hypothetical protein
VPSFRVILSIGALQAGVAAASVLPSVAASAATITTVEASGVDVVRGSARITIRFTADDDITATGVARQVIDSTRSLADVPSWMITRRTGGRWYPLAPITTPRTPSLPDEPLSDTPLG